MIILSNSPDSSENPFMFFGKKHKKLLHLTFIYIRVQ